MCVIIKSNFKTTDLKISTLSTSDDLEKEAKAFDERIEERTKAVFIPDVRRAVKCEYFYKSFFRDPYLIKLFLQEEINYFLEMLKKYSYPGARILDVGCGSGYISLELARSGYHVTGIDISSKVIDVAKKTLESNPFKDGFGSLKYHVSSFDEFDGKFDVVLFCGIIHHIRNPEKAILGALDMLNPTGLLMCEEPSHERWRKQDAAQVALIRSLLSLTGNWYETSLGEDLLEQEIFDWAASFQHAAVDSIIHGIQHALAHNDVRCIVAGGGVLANTLLRKQLVATASSYNIPIHLPDFKYCVDNAAMIAGLGYHLFEIGHRDQLNVTASPKGIAS